MKRRKLNFPDPVWAVFNGHYKGAHRKALGVMRASLGEAAVKKIKGAARKGIMAIFDRPPTEVTESYAWLVFIFANELL